MTIDKRFIDQFINVTVKAALASSYFVGKKNKIAADKAAVDSMRKELNKINIKGKIVIGEGEYDHLPEAAFYMVGTIEEAIEKAEKMAKDAAA